MSVTLKGSGQTPVQIAQTVKTDTFSSSVTSAWTDITGFSVNITPTNSSNKVLVQVSITASGQQNYPRGFAIVRNSTLVCTGNAGTGIPATFCIGELAAGRDTETYSFSYLDSPATTSATTYKLQFYCPPSSTTGILVNRGATQDGNSFLSTSTITVSEIAYA
jgi:hypothetical protein